MKGDWCNWDAEHRVPEARRGGGKAPGRHQEKETGRASCPSRLREAQCEPRLDQLKGKAQG